MKKPEKCHAQIRREGGRHPLKILITNQFQIKLPIIRLYTPSKPQQTKYPLRTPSRKKPTILNSDMTFD